MRLGRPLTQRNRFYGLVKVFEAESTVTLNSENESKNCSGSHWIRPYSVLYRSVTLRMTPMLRRKGMI